MDESGISMNYKNGKVVVENGAKQAHWAKAKGQRDHVTVNCCVSANGQTIPRFIIYKKVPKSSIQK